MTLRELRAAHRFRFHPTQDWFVSEAFLDREVQVGLPLPHGIVNDPALPGGLPGDARMLPFAAVLADLFVRHPDHSMWDRYLWCADTDAQGQRIYVGHNGRGFEIHRHLHLTPRWGIALWT